MAADMLPRIKYIAVYQTYPHCAITSVAPVRSIERWPAHPGKFVVNFAEPARKIGPIPLGKKEQQAVTRSALYQLRTINPRPIVK